MAADTFRILVLGDLSGRANRGAAGEGLGNRRPRRVDRDDLETALAAMAASLRLPAPGGGTVTLRFASLADFRPEAVVRQVETLSRLAALRTRLMTPATFGAASEEMLAWGIAAPAAAPKAPPPAQPKAPVSDASLFDQILGEATVAEEVAAVVAAPQAADEVASLIREVAGPGLAALRTPGRHPRQDEYVAQVDAVISAALGPILHHPDFQALESVWRSLQRLVRRIDTGGGLDVYVLDATRMELARDLGVSGDFSRSALHRIVVEEVLSVPNAKPWTLLLGAYALDATAADVSLLLRAAKVARAGGAAFLAGADGRLVGCTDIAASTDPDDWMHEGEAAGRDFLDAFRRFPEARSAALVWPRVLLRATYGQDSDEAEGLGYEETARPLPHAGHLWGNGAFLVAEMLAEAWTREPSDLRSALEADRDGFPAVYRDDDGDRALVACAEAYLPERALAAIRERGVIALASHRGSTTVRVASLVSLASPDAELAGPWAQD